MFFNRRPPLWPINTTPMMLSSSGPSHRSRVPKKYHLLRCCPRIRHMQKPSPPPLDCQPEGYVSRSILFPFLTYYLRKPQLLYHRQPQGMSDFDLNWSLQESRKRLEREREREGNSNKLSASELKDVFGITKGQSREEDDSVATPTVVTPSTEHGFEVGDMVWGKVKFHPWWPGHVFSEELATTSVRRSKRDGLLLVAFFGDSSYGWFDSSELVPFDSNFDEKSLQTNSKAFAKALEEAIDEVRRRSGLGLSCMCRNSKNSRQTSVQGYYAADVVGYEPGAVYSTDTIKKARDSFQPRLAMEFLKQLAMEPTDEHDDIDFIKNKAIVLSYRRAIYQEVDETYKLAVSLQFLIMTEMMYM